MKKVYLFLLTLLVTIGLLAGCGGTEDNNAADEGNDKETQTEQTEESSFPVTITHTAGEEITLEEKPERIVSVLPSNTEIAFALGLGEQIVGVSDHDNYPEEATKKEKVGGLELNVEKILSLEPQLVLADESNGEKALNQLKETGIPVLILPESKDFEGVYKSIKTVGKATGTTDKAQEVIDGMKNKLADLKEKASEIEEGEQKTVFVELSPSPEIYTPGKNTFMDKLLSIVNAKNAAADQDGWVKMNQEAIVSLNPDVIITNYGSYVDDPVAEVTGRDGWEDVTAVKKEQIYDVNQDIVNRPGPRLVEGAEELGKAIYPEVFGSK